ncbi:hypothetical protein C0Q70_07549 [Pomacea canaliculata]|uniref:G-protein coupled receptors family 1 profile domain-containing protein n=2 Tax=Pomacea canaliculata TaxID=400727 RepID=A0A2T7PFB8_POMCA|nr:hypothetical protein C0Q70_07549 [Pomacea canaliculata]
MYRGTLRRRPQTPTLGSKLSKVINSDMGAKGISLMMFVLSFIMTIPVITVYSNAPENSCLFKLQDGFSCYLACGVSREMKDSVIAKTFFSFAFIVFVATVVPMVVLYAVVGCRIRASERDRQELEVKSRQMSPRRPYSMHVSYPDCPSPKPTMTRQRSMPINEREPEAAAAVSGAYNGGSTYFPPISYSAHFASAPHLAHIFEDINEGNVRDFAQCSTTSFQMAKRGSKARNTTFALMLISMAYVMSYLPYLSLTMVRRFTKAWCESDEAPEIIIATEFFRRTYLISSAINPLIYGFCNPTFRKVLWKLLARRRDVI